jgi:hypothetical protein
MTPEQLQQLRAKLAGGRQPDYRLDERRVFCRGWNAGLDFVERCIKEVTGENA